MVTVAPRSGREHPLVRGVPPDWAQTWGQDRYGVFAGIVLGEVEYRFRWIPGGKFLMGSPEGEAGRAADEVPHEVHVSEFWLGDTPVTQRLWEEIEGENPSRFRHEMRPVERVSWEDCQRFCERLAERAPGLMPRLPTEAEWEYACRAGTNWATYAGDLEILGANHAPVLDPIAWYGGNSGVGFDLDEGYSSSGWPEKQHEFAKAGSRCVAEKLPNPWGLFDMLGNVWEWCEDWRAPYDPADSRDPRGPGSGLYRVLRGGSWSDEARVVRAARRLGLEPGLRYDGIGFRLARGPALRAAEQHSGGGVEAGKP